MLDYKADIISGKSLANFQIGHNIIDSLPYLYDNNVNIKISIYNENKKNEIHRYIIDKKIKVNTLPNGEILNITSFGSYEGNLNKKIKSGMSIEEIKNNSKKQIISNGCLFLNDDYGFCYILPPPYDEIADSINNIPNHLKLNEICVSDFSWWFNPNLTPEYAK